MTLRLLPVTGPPGAGKTTNLMAVEQQQPSIARFGVRDFGFQLAREGHPLGLAIEGPLARHELLANEAVAAELECFLDQLPGGAQSVAIEGYPRDIPQCEDLLAIAEERRVEVAALLVLDAPHAVTHQRVAGRRVCTQCGLSAPTHAPGPCCRCGADTTTRADDESARLEVRLAEYSEQGAAVRDFFARRGLLRTIDASQSPSVVQKALADIFRAE
jgi:adenylate kinase